MIAPIALRQSAGKDAVDGNADKSMQTTAKRYKVALVSDFFLPRLGGVEIHIWSLAQCLLRLGHKVIVVTQAGGDRTGVRSMTNGLKVYYVEWASVWEGNSYPSGYFLFPLLRQIFLRERIEIVHGHAGASSMANEALLHAKTMGLKTCYTDHSLFAYGDMSGIHLNKAFRITEVGLDAAIAVSHVCRENLVLRAFMKPDRVFTIPNAVDSRLFAPQKLSALPTNDQLNVVFIGRLAHRKGISLMAKVIPVACEEFPEVKFIIGGDGPMRLILDEMVENYQLQERVELLGKLAYSQVQDVLRQGTIFLNCSLTESFGSAIIEAACCGLYVVSTGVGGVPEVLPPEMINYTREHTVENILAALGEAIELARNGKIDRFAQHKKLTELYSWPDVARRTVKVYDHIMSLPDLAFTERCYRARSIGPFVGILSIVAVTVDFMILKVLEWLYPAATIDAAPDIALFPSEAQVNARTKRSTTRESS